MKLLVTGGTGNLGGAVLAELAQSHPDIPVVATARADSSETARNRLANSIARFHVYELPAHWEFRCADFTRPESIQALADLEATHVLHLAANTSFRSVRSVRATNLHGTLIFAHALRRSSAVRRFLWVGTAYICGNRAAPVVREADYPRWDVQHLAEYASSKSECEQLLRETAPELPLVIARPSAAVGHTTLGVEPTASLFWYYRTVVQMRRIASSPDARRDIVPIDYAASALIHLLLKPTLAHDCYHISAGHQAVTWLEMADAFSALPDYAGSREAFSVIERSDLPAERERALAYLGPGDVDRMLEALGFYWRFSASGVEVFDNQRLLAEGTPPPPRFTEYLAKCSRKRSVYEQMRDDD